MPRPTVIVALARLAELCAERQRRARFRVLASDAEDRAGWMRQVDAWRHEERDTADQVRRSGGQIPFVGSLAAVLGTGYLTFRIVDGRMPPPLGAPTSQSTPQPTSASKPAVPARRYPRWCPSAKRGPALSPAAGSVKLAVTGRKNKRTVSQ